MKTARPSFKLSINVKHAMANAAGAALFAAVLGFGKWIILGFAIYGGLGGSINDTISYLRNYRSSGNE